MFFKRLIQWLSGGEEFSKPPSHSKTYSERYAETSAMSSGEIRELIAERERAGKRCGAAYRVLADRSNRKATKEQIDPPRSGRKTYQERHDETCALSTAEIRAKIAEREAQGKECGVLYLVLSDRV